MDNDKSNNKEIDNGDKTQVVISQKKEININNEKLNKKDNEDVELNITSSSEGLNNDIQNANVSEDSVVGTIIKNRYEIESLTGHGGLCDVYRAKDKVLEASGADSCSVALKILQPEFASQAETARMLIREAQQTQKLSHPSIVRVFDFGVDNDVYYIVMEHLEGETLEDLIKRNRPNGLSYKPALDILTQVFDALEYAHSQNIIHADLKPANVMVTSTGRVKLLDFGVSKVHSLEADKYSALKSSEATSAMGYTPNYASLNLLKGGTPKREDDIYALCCILYELLTCKHPFARTPVDQAIKNKLVVSKPKSLQFGKWRFIHSILIKGGPDASVTVQMLKNHLHSNPWPKLTSMAAVLAGVALAGYFINEKQLRINELEKKLSNVSLSQQEHLDLLDMAPELATDYLAQQDTVHPLLRAGYLRLHKAHYLGEYEAKIDEILNLDTTTYPNYELIEAAISEAKVLYPDSHKLRILEGDIKSSKHSTLLTIARQINTLLEKSAYSAPEGEKSIFELKLDLAEIHEDYDFTPSSLASDTFGRNLTEALKAKDAASLSILITTGNHFFTKVEKHNENLSVGNSIKDAVLEMNLYQNAADSDHPLPYPNDAARTLYKEELDGLDYRLEQANTTKDLDKLVKDINSLATELPTGFDDINDIRFKTANKYLKFSSILLNKRKSKSAQKAVKKANALLQEIESTKQS